MASKISAFNAVVSVLFDKSTLAFRSAYFYGGLSLIYLNNNLSCHDDNGIANFVASINVESWKLLYTLKMYIN